MAIGGRATDNVTDGTARGTGPRESRGQTWYREYIEDPSSLLLRPMLSQLPAQRKGFRGGHVSQPPDNAQITRYFQSFAKYRAAPEKTRSLVPFRQACSRGQTGNPRNRLMLPPRMKRKKSHRYYILAELKF